jgi:hypothetical protein
MAVSISLDDRHVQYPVAAKTLNGAEILAKAI